MKIILTQEVKGKGHEGDVVDVTRGYAVNYLLPRDLAIEATPGNLKQLESRMRNIEKRNADRRSAAENVAEALEGKAVVIEAKAGDGGKLFGSVTTTMIEEAVAAQLKQDVDHRRMDLAHPIREIGEHLVTVGVYGDVRASLTVRVLPEGGALVSEPVVVAESPAEAQAEADSLADEAAEDGTEANVDVADEPTAEIEEETDEAVAEEDASEQQS